MKGQMHQQVRNGHRLYSQAELAKCLGCSSQAVGYMVRKGIIIPDRIGNTGLPKFSFERFNEILASRGIICLPVEE